MFGVSDSCKTELEAIQAVLLHEIGHHIGMSSPSLATQALEKGAPISQYARVDGNEYFAESYAMYRIDRVFLKQHDPVGHSMVQEVLQLQGIKI